MSTLDDQLADLTRGALDVIDRAELRTKLERGAPLVVKFGADPTAPDLHLGHSVPLHALRRYQDHGHRVQFLIGDFTGAIGDPSGRNTMRPQLTHEQIRAAGATYVDQVSKILRPDVTEVVYNSTWMSAMSAADFVVLASKWTVSNMLERDDFAQRFASRVQIGIHEFLYPLVQGYDSVAMRADVEMGGSDQRFNLLVGRDLQRAYGQEPQVVVTVPLLVGTDGIDKMSKSKGNHVGIAEAPSLQVQKTMAITDATMLKWYALLSDRSPDGQPPRDAKLALAREIVTRYHGHAAANAAIDEYERKAAGGEPDTMPELTLAPTSLADTLIAISFATSRRDAWAKVKNGEIGIDGVVATDAGATLAPRTYVLRWGKNRFARVIVTTPSPRD